MNWRALDHILDGEPVNPDGRPVRVLQVARLDQAITKQWPIDCFALMYGVQPSPDPATWTHANLMSEDLYRLTTAAPADLVENGWVKTRDQLQGWGIIIDVDLKDYYAKDHQLDLKAVGKVPWDDAWRKRWSDEIWPEITKKFPMLAQPTVAYTSANGIRLIYAFSRPIPLLGAGGLLHRLRGFMAKSILSGLYVDRATKDWTRLQRLPQVAREKEGNRSELTHEQSYFRLSWGRLDLDAKEIYAPDEFVVHPPEAFPMASEFEARNYIDHPDAALLLRVLSGSGDELEGTYRVHVDCGYVPESEEVTAILQGSKGITGMSQRHRKAKDIIRKAADRSAEDSVVPVAASRVYSVIWDGARVDTDNNLHDNVYRLISDLCFLLNKELGPSEGAIDARLIYSLVIAPAQAANNARDENDKGRRSDSELEDEVWRMVCSVFTKCLGKRQMEEQERERLEMERQELKTALSKGGSPVHRQIVANAFKEWLGVDDEWIDQELDGNLITVLPKGYSVIQIRNERAVWSEVVSSYTALLPFIRTAGHQLIEYQALPESPEDEARPVTRPLNDVIVDHGFSITHVRASRLIESSRLEWRIMGGVKQMQQVLKLPGMAEDIQPIADPVAEEFLSIFCGDNLSVMLNWFACYFKIEAPLPALYIDGPPGCGKGLLLDALAQGTASKMSADFSDSLSDFQDHYADTPLLIVDEGMSSGSNRKDIVEVLRRLIGGQFRKINLKGVKGMDIDGEWRLVMCANNADVLDIRKDLSSQDIEALNGRILYHHISDEQGQQLKDFFKRQGGRYGRPGGPAGTVAYNLPLKIIQHIKWLEQTREVEYGERFLVDAPATPWHEHLRVTTSGGIEVCKAINVALLEKRHVGRGTGVIVQQDRKRILVEAKTFESFARNLLGQQAPRDVLKTLKRLTTGETRPRLDDPGDRAEYGPRPRCWILDLRAVLMALHQRGYDTDWREILGMEFWRQVAPPTIQDQLKDVELGDSSHPEDPRKLMGPGSDRPARWGNA